ncbi:unnamed protein product, partial [Aphanomyces euteiches]
MSPGEPDESAKPFVLPAASPPTDPSGGGSTPKRDESRQDRSTSSGGKSAQPTKGSVKSTSKSSDKAAGTGQESRKRLDQGPIKNPQKASGPDSSRGQKGQENPPGSVKKLKAAEDNRGEKTKPASEAKTLGKGKKQAAPVVVADPNAHAQVDPRRNRPGCLALTLWRTKCLAMTMTTRRKVRP